MQIKNFFDPSWNQKDARISMSMWDAPFFFKAEDHSKFLQAHLYKETINNHFGDANNLFFSVPEEVKVANPYWNEHRELATFLLNGGQLKKEHAGQFPDAERIQDQILGKFPRPTDASFIMRICRDYFVWKYSWSITTPQNVKLIASVAGDKVVEIGAGNGYWAYLLAQYGIKVYAYDNHIRPVKIWHDLTYGGTDAVKQHPDCTLLLVWPPYGTPMGAECVEQYEGDTIIYVGEESGCTGDDDLEDLLYNTGDWALIATIANTNWPGINDRIRIFKRNNINKKQLLHL